MAKGNFPACLAFTLAQEGGFSDNPSDPGGRTMHGVTQNTYDTWRAHRGVQSGDVAQISDAELQAIYRNGYWDAIGAEDLALGVDLCSFDYAVNSGPKKAIAELAKAMAGNPPTEQIINNLCSERLSFLHALGIWSHFGVGWGKRVAACEARALTMANASLAPIACNARKNQSEHDAKTAGAAAVGAGAVAGYHFAPHNLWIIGVLGALAAIVAIVNVFMAWRQRQRRDALDAALADMAAKKRALDASRLAEAAQKAAVAANIVRQQRQIEAAEQAEATLNNSASISASSAPSPIVEPKSK